MDRFWQVIKDMDISVHISHWKWPDGIRISAKRTYKDFGCDYVVYVQPETITCCTTDRHMADAWDRFWQVLASTIEKELSDEACQKMLEEKLKGE